MKTKTIQALLCSLLLTTILTSAPAADQFVKVTNPGWTNSSQYSWTGAWGDYDDDGSIDLFVPNSAPDWNIGWTNFLYHNNGDGTFTRKSATEVGPIASDKDSSLGGYWGDFNNDGHLDLFVINFTWSGTVKNRLYLNRGNGTFKSLDAADLTKPFYPSAWGGLADYDNDGVLDALVCAAWSGSGHRTNLLFHGRGDGTFNAVTNCIVATDKSNNSNDAAWGDFDNDGDMDLILSNWDINNLFYRNDGDGQFTRLTNSLLAKYTSGHNAWGDCDNDGFLDLASGSSIDLRLFQNIGGTNFVLSKTWGIYGTPAWADYDNDGYLDLILFRGQGTMVNLCLFHNNGDGNFTQVQDAFTRTPGNWLGGAWGDYDNDGFIDLFVADETGKNALYHNLSNTNHWIKFRLQGTAANRTAIGAKVRVKATIGGKTLWQMREVSGGNSCQNDLRPNFGLGDATNVDLVRIEWPSGNLQELTDVAPDRLLTLTEPTLITPSRPSVSLNGSVTLTRTSVPSSSYQWQFNGVDLAGQTSRTLNLTNIVADQQGHFSVVASNVTTITTNFVYLVVDTTFTKITTGPVVTDLGWWGGPTWWDYDNDGFMDLYVPNAGVRDGVYHNKGDGTFSLVTNELNKVAHDYIAGVVGDYNNSGLASILLFRWNNLKEDLYRNKGSGNFSRLTPFNDYSAFGGGWADYDRDGFLDLFVANTGPSTINDSLYHNNGDGTFAKMTASQVGGLVTDKDTTGPCTWVDYDNDGWPDLWVGAGLDVGVGTSGRQYLWRNNGDGAFSRVSGASAGSLTNDCATAFALWADYDNDGYPDVFLSAEWYGTSSLHHNVGGRTFTDVSMAAGVPHVMKTIGAAWGDYDNDGYLDLMVAAFFAADRSILYHNNGDGTFTSIDVGSPLRDGGNRQGVAWADYDKDGFLDLLITCYSNNFASKKLLYHNNGNSNTWLEVKLIGTASNQSAIGAKVRIQATIRGQKMWQMREINGNSAYSGGACGLLAHFGLGDATKVDTLRIEWPSGNVQELTDVAPDRLLTLTEPTLITPSRPSVSLNGSVTLTRTSVASASYQWQFNGVDLAGQTNRTLNLTNIVADQQGHYSVVASNSTTLTTNFVYLRVDTQFTKITEGALVTDREGSFAFNWGDYDGDGLLDVFVTSSLGKNALYHNNGGSAGEWSFSRITSDALALPRHSWAGIWGDYDNDGRPNLFVADVEALSGNVVLAYLGPGPADFASLTRTKVGPIVGDRFNAYDAAWGDYDNDGFLDLYVGNSGASVLYRNNQNGSFSRLTAQQAGPPVSESANSLQCAWVDFDNDGDLDLFVRHYGAVNRLYLNDGQGRFSRMTQGSLVKEFVNDGWGCWGDFDNDGFLDLFSARYLAASALHRNLAGQDSTNVAAVAGVELKMDFLNGGAWGDYDNDGWLDLLVVNGTGANIMFHNNGNSTFTPVDIGSPLRDSDKNVAAEFVDFNNDGFLDLFISQEQNLLYHNNGNGNAWLKVKPMGTASNRSGIGAKVRVRATIGGRQFWQLREISAGNAFSGTTAPVAHFGLGNATKVTTLRIEWPSGTVQEFANVVTNQFLTLWEPPAISAAVRADGGCELNIKAEPNRGWQIQASGDLITWQTLTTVTNTTVEFKFTDTAAAGMDCRFYRVESK